MSKKANIKKELGRSRLNAMQKRFCESIVAGNSVGDAYVAAGYSVKSRKSAQSAGSRLLANVGVQRYIDALQRMMRLEMGMTTTSVLQQVLAIATSNVTDYIDLNGDTISFKDIAKLDPLKQSAISEVYVTPGQYGNTCRLKLHPKQPALDLLFRYLGLDDNLDRAISIFRTLGYEVIPTLQGYRMVDAYSEQLDEAEGAEDLKEDP